MNPAISLAVRCTLILSGLVIYAAAPAAPSQPKKPANGAAALAGDWQYIINGPIKMYLHLKVGADGALTGTIDTADSTPKHVEITNIQLSGNILKYTFPPMGNIMEVIQPDGNSMLGAQIWQRVAAAVPIADVTGDWESRTKQMLHLRVGPNGLLTGSLETANSPQRVDLQEVSILGTTITFTLADGKKWKGTFSSDHHSIAGMEGNPSWQRTRTLDQALAMETAENAKKKLPTDGIWIGTIEHILYADMTKTPPKGVIRYVLHLGSVPASCTVRLEVPRNEGDRDPPDLPCGMKREGSTVTVDSLYSGSFSGAWSGNQIAGSWTATNRIIFVGYSDKPMKLTLTRSAADAGH